MAVFATASLSQSLIDIFIIKNIIRVTCSPSATGDAVQLLLALALACSSIYYVDNVACRHSTTGGVASGSWGREWTLNFSFSCMTQ